MLPKMFYYPQSCLENCICAVGTKTQLFNSQIFRLESG